MSDLVTRQLPNGIKIRGERNPPHKMVKAVNRLGEVVDLKIDMASRDREDEYRYTFTRDYQDEAEAHQRDQAEKREVDRTEMRAPTMDERIFLLVDDFGGLKSAELQAEIKRRREKNAAEIQAARNSSVNAQRDQAVMNAAREVGAAAAERAVESVTKAAAKAGKAG